MRWWSAGDDVGWDDGLRNWWDSWDWWDIWKLSFRSARLVREVDKLPIVFAYSKPCWLRDPFPVCVHEDDVSSFMLMFFSLVQAVCLLLASGCATQLQDVPWGWAPASHMEASAASARIARLIVLAVLGLRYRSSTQVQQTLYPSFKGSIKEQVK